MGGNVFKTYKTTRLDAKDYFDLTYDFDSIFFDNFNFCPVLIKAYRKKESFGDADYLVDSSKLPENWIEKLKDTFCLTPEQYSKNSNVISIGWRNFQFDLIVTAHEDMIASEFYFSYNDFGNLIGRIGHKLGIKIGHKGTSIVIRHKERADRRRNAIARSRLPVAALANIGLSLTRYAKGFDTLEEMFDYVASSKYFDREIYSLEHRSATSRIRDKKRATYNAFLKWVDEKHPWSHHSFKEKSELGGYSIRMPYYETEVLSRFPWVKDVVDATIASFELDLRFKEVYNGVIVSEQTGLTGKELGMFMKEVKEKYVLDDDTKRRWIEFPMLVHLTVKNVMKYDLGAF